MHMNDIYKHYRNCERLKIIFTEIMKIRNYYHEVSHLMDCFGELFKYQVNEWIPDYLILRAFIYFHNFVINDTYM